jgi:hypothetical protein
MLTGGVQVLSLLVARCLERDPHRRITARAALDHAFLLANSASDTAGREALAQWCAQAQAGRDGWGDSGGGGHRALPQRGLEGLERSIEGLLSFFGRAPSA